MYGYQCGETLVCVLRMGVRGKEKKKDLVFIFNPYCKFHVHDNFRVCVYSLM